MPWQIVVLLLSLGQLPTFYPLHFQRHEISLRVPSITIFFACVTLRHFHPSCHTTFLIYVNLSAFTKSLWLHVRSQWWQHPQSMVSYFFYNSPSMCDSNFTPSIITLCFFAVQFPLSMIHFCKICREFISGRQKGNTATHCGYTWTV